MFKKENPPVEIKPKSARPPEAPLRKPKSPSDSRPKPTTIKTVTNSVTVLSADSHVKGEITGDTDVQISGKFEGTINIPKNTVTIEKEGKAKAALNASTIVLHGQLKGNISGIDSVIIKSTGIMDGDIKAGNVILEKHCQFNGSIETVKKTGAVKVAPKPPSNPSARKPAQPAAKPTIN